MLKLQFELEYQKINLVNRWETVAADSKNYLVAQFNAISDDWTTPITAIFTNDKDEQPYAVVVGADSTLESNECYVPWKVLKDESNVYVSAYCGNLHTTVTAQFHVYKSGYADGETPPPPSPTVYDAIMEAITALQTGKQDKLIAGENITIDEDNVISAEGGVTSYNGLTDKPQINSVELSGNKNLDDLGMQAKIDNSHKLFSDLIDDTNNTNKFVTSSEKTTWGNKYNKPSGGIPKNDLSSTVQASLSRADSALQDQDLSGYVTTAEFTTGLALKANAQDVNTALTQKVNITDMVPYLHYVVAESSAPEEGTTYSLADRTPNSYSYINSDWYGDKPSNLTGVAWIFTIIPRSTSSYGMQFCLKPQNNSLYIRTKTKQSNVYVWSNWSTFSDASLSVKGAFADAKAVGDVFATSIKYKEASPSDYNNTLSNIEKNTCSYVAGSSWDDAPVTSVGLIITTKTDANNYGSQIWISNVPASNQNYQGIYVRRFSSNAWTAWSSLVDATLSETGLAADAKAVGDRISKVAFKTTGKYYAFGDSLVKAQVGRWNDPSQPKYSTRGYVDTTAKILHMNFDNQAVGGQGLITDWGKPDGTIDGVTYHGIIERIFNLDMTDATLITIGWSGNDGYSWGLSTCAMGTYTDTTDDLIIDGEHLDFTSAESLKKLVVYDEHYNPTAVRTTVVGFYYTIMKLLQIRCPKAQIVLVSGYGTPGGNSSQHILAQLTDQFTHMTTYGTGGNHTTKERYDELEKMANIHGWPCVNQAKGCCFNEFNAPYVFGDQAHPTDEGYAMYGNSLANRIAAFYGNRSI